MELNQRDDTLYFTDLDVDTDSVPTIGVNGKQAITKAVIIAAGNGSRLQGYQSGRPKPLVNLGGMPLLQRVILSAKKIGVTEFVIVIGYQAARIRKTINARKLGVKITWVRNPDWKKPNGVSVLKAEKYVDGKFLLFMSDHVFDFKILNRVKDYDLTHNSGVLCVDYAVNQVQDLDDATKVRTENNRLLNLGKNLTDFNAIDVGIFICMPDLFAALRQSQEFGDESLSGGIRILSEAGRMATFDIGGAFWQDVDTVPDSYHAEKLLLRSTRSPNDGIIAKTINRKISNRITKWLLKTPITPNQISIFNLFFSIFIAWLVAAGTPVNIIMGGILFQLVSILDGCDGEVAVIKLRDSKRGALVDTVTDHLSYVAFIIGITVGAYNVTQNSMIFAVTAFTLLFLFFALKFGLQYMKKKGSGSLRELDKGIAGLNHDEQKVWYLKALGSIHHLGRRDVFSFAAFLFMLSGNVVVVYSALIIAVLLISAGIAITAASLLSKSSGLNPFKATKRYLCMAWKWLVSSDIDLQSENEISTDYSNSRNC